MHPAFDFGGEQLSGIWIGKFETTGSSTVPNILPNDRSLMNQNISTQFSTAQKFNSYLNNAGDSHMSKNSEWGAVAYLSQSIYGKYGNIEYNGKEKEIYINNSNGTYTGRSGGAPGGSTATVQEQYPGQSSSTHDYCDKGYYTYDGYKLSYYGSITEERDINKGTGASTTGNIYGVYDMSGGSGEYVMGYLTTAYKKTWGARTSSGTEEDYAKFTSRPDAKYYDAYKDSLSTKICSGESCYGHALTETKYWYSDTGFLVSDYEPWFYRGGDYYNSSGEGIFSYSFAFGEKYPIYSFRVVISPTM